jgi:hypothetical protein
LKIKRGKLEYMKEFLTAMHKLVRNYRLLQQQAKPAVMVNIG